MKAFTKQEEGEVLFLLSLLQDSFGGTPSVGVAAEDNFIIVNRCSCPKCTTFNKIYPPKASKTLLQAAKLYGDNMLCFNQTEEMFNDGSNIH